MMLNARSIMNKIDHLELTVCKYDPDIIGITESWCTPSVSDSELQLINYDLFRCDRDTDNKGGGVLLYVKSKLKPREIVFNSPFKDQIWCKIAELYIGVCYRSTNYCIVGPDNNKYMYQLLREVSNKHFLLMGDFNYPDIDWLNNTVADDANADCKEFFDCFNDCFLSQHIVRPTRNNSILDLVLTREPDLVSNTDVIENLGNSDHSMVTFSVLHQQSISENARLLRDYCKGDYQSIRNHLVDVDWDAFMSDDTLKCWSKFKDLMLDLEQRFVPLKKLCKRNQKKKPIWMTNKALRSVEKKSKVYKKYKDKDHPAVKQANRTTVKEIKKAKRNFEKKLAQNIKQDSKSFFAYARSKMKSKIQTGSILDDNGTLLDSDTSVVRRFNEYFSSVFTAENTATLPLQNPIQPPQNLSINDLHFDVESVSKVLAKLRPDKSMGPDGLAPMLLIETRDLISYPLYLLFNKSIKDTVIPDDWKQASVTPIFKKGNRNKAENYRPVSLTSLICKTFETIIRDSLVQYLENNRLITDSQHGFRKGRSCVTNLLEFLDKVTGYVDSGENVDVVFLDFAKAFDKVPHKRLILKLRNHGIQGVLLGWITEWLKGRKQKVGIRGVSSDWADVLSGVPQGSVLGPLLFLVYINDLDFGIDNWILKFADDSKIFSRITGKCDHKKLQDDLNKLATWSETWQMLFNTSKCKVMHIGKSQMHYPYFMNNQKLEEVIQEKDLGVLISNDLKVSQQCQLACGKATRILGMIHRTITFKHPVILIRLYKSLVRPHLEYCTAAWSPYYCKDKELIERVQRRFTRMIPDFRNLPYEQRLAETKLWSLEDRRVRADLVEVYKIVHGLSTVRFDTFFELSHNDRTRGHSLKLNKRRVQLNLRQHFFSERVIDKWNKLSEDTVSALSLNSFKGKLQRLYVDGSSTGFFKST